MTDLTADLQATFGVVADGTGAAQGGPPLGMWPYASAARRLVWVPPLPLWRGGWADRFWLADACYWRLTPGRVAWLRGRHEADRGRLAGWRAGQPAAWLDRYAAQLGRQAAALEREAAGLGRVAAWLAARGGAPQAAERPLSATPLPPAPWPPPVARTQAVAAAATVDNAADLELLAAAEAAAAALAARPAGRVLPLGLWGGVADAAAWSARLVRECRQAVPADSRSRTLLPRQRHWLSLLVDAAGPTRSAGGVSGPGSPGPEPPGPDTPVEYEPCLNRKEGGPPETTEAADDAGWPAAYGAAGAADYTPALGAVPPPAAAP